MNNFNLFCYKIKTENLIYFCKEYFWSFNSFLDFEFEDHGDLLEVFVILKNYSMNLFECFTLVAMFDLFENEELIYFVFLFN